MIYLFINKLESFLKEEISLKEVIKWCSNLIRDDNIELLANEVWLMEIVYYFDEIEDYNEKQKEIVCIFSSHALYLLKNRVLDYKEKSMILDLLFILKKLEKLVDKLQDNCLKIEDLHKSIKKASLSNFLEKQLLSLSKIEWKELLNSLRENEFEKVLKIIQN